MSKSLYTRQELKVMCLFHFRVYLLFQLCTSVCCWQYFTKMSDIILSNSFPDPDLTHSEYIYGDCRNKNKVFYTQAHISHLEVLGKLILRGWLNIARIPTCIIIRGTAYEYDLFRSTAYNFQICVPRITYCHSQKRFNYYYYEWYVPTDLVGGMDWDLLFFGPVNKDW